MSAHQYGDRSGDFSSKPYAQQRDLSAIVGQVAKDPNGIGFFAAAPDFPIDKRVKLLAIAKDEKSEAYLPTAENVYEGKYPLVERLTMYVHPDAPPEAIEFCRFATSEESAEIIRKHRLFPEYDRRKYFSEQRLAAAKKGEGIQLNAFGHRAGLSVLRSLAGEYVKAREPVQLRYTVKAELPAVEEFFQRETDLLLLDQPLSDKTLDKHMHTWLALHPEKFDIAQVGVGVIVHPLNKLNWLKIEELQNIYTSRVKNWTGIDRYETTATATNGTAVDTAIRRFGLKGRGKSAADRPTVELFREAILNGKRMQRVVPFADSQEVINAVSLDQNAIGFINLADLDTSAANVKLLGIIPAGKSFPATVKSLKQAAAEALAAAAKANGNNKGQTPPARPKRFADWEVSADYPLLRQWTLYVDRRSSDAAWRFAQFVEATEAAKQSTMTAADIDKADDTSFGDGTEVTTALRERGLIRPAQEEPFAVKKAGPKPVFALP